MIWKLLCLQLAFYGHLHKMTSFSSDFLETVLLIIIVIDDEVHCM